MINKNDSMYHCWLEHKNLKNSPYRDYFKEVVVINDNNAIKDRNANKDNHAMNDNNVNKNNSSMNANNVNKNNSAMNANNANKDNNINKDNSVMNDINVSKKKVKDLLIDSALKELSAAHLQIYGRDSKLHIYNVIDQVQEDKFILLHIISSDKAFRSDTKNMETFSLALEKKFDSHFLSICAYSAQGLLYGVFALLRLLDCNHTFSNDPIWQTPTYSIRMINHWDNIDGTVERGYAGGSIFFESKRNKELTKLIMDSIGISANHEFMRKAFHDEYDIAEDTERINDYGRLLCSIGINSVVINNTNVHAEETTLISSRIEIVKTISDILAKWGIRTFLSINYAAPITLQELDTADPLDERVQKWWKEKTAYLYNQIPNLGGFMVKADSEGRPGPFTYGRNHAEGANMLGAVLKPFGGILIWRCFVYNCRQDWRDRSTDRACAAYDCFSPLDGKFLNNVYLQIKNGPMDFQVREPIAPLFGTMEHTNKLMELQITGEYTGQQKHVCYLIPWWKEILNFQILNQEKVSDRIAGVAAVANIGNDLNWTGHALAVANLYGYGRLIWDCSLSSEQITREWIMQTFGYDPIVITNISEILLDSWHTYENYTTPLGVGFMVSPGHHYGPDVDGYEYSRWGTYHHADHNGIGIDRTLYSGTGYVGQYNEPFVSKYNKLSTCPDELLLFFHHVPYNYVLHSGKTVIQHIYDSHFEGYERVKEYIAKWSALKGYIPDSIYSHTLDRLQTQLGSARDWCDQINSYFYRLSDIKDVKGRIIY